MPQTKVSVGVILQSKKVPVLDAVRAEPVRRFIVRGSVFVVAQESGHDRRLGFTWVGCLVDGRANLRGYDMVTMGLYAKS